MRSLKVVYFPLKIMTDSEDQRESRDLKSCSVTMDELGYISSTHKQSSSRGNGDLLVL